MNRKVSLVLSLSAFLLLLTMAGCSEEKITAPDPGSDPALSGDTDQDALDAQLASAGDPDKSITDIAVTAFSAPPSVSPGGVLPLSATVTNLGSRDVRFDFTVRVFEPNSGITIARRTVAGLAAGQAKSTTVDFLVPAKDLAAIQAVTPGVYTLVCKHYYFFDPIPSNNSKSIQVEVLPGGEFGNVIVNPDPNALNAPWSVLGPDGAVYNGTGDLTLPSVTPGSYTVSWGAVPGWNAPADQTLDLVAGGTITFNGLYTEIPTFGTVVLNPEPDALRAPWSLVGPDKAVYDGTGDTTLPDVPTGSYTVTWGAVAGWTTPAPETLLLGDGATITFTGLYTEIPQVGTVVINPDPDALDAPWSVTGPGKAVYDGTGDFTLVDVPAGDYAITWGSVPGWIAPAGEMLTLTTGGTITFNGLYTEIPTVGTVVINPDPDALDAPWSVVGPDKAVYDGTGDFTLVDVPTGDYAMTWGSVPGWTAPAGEILNLTTGATISFNGLYTEILTVGTVVINPDPDGLNAPWSVVGPDKAVFNGNGDFSLTDVPTGDYTVTWGDVAGWTTPSPETLALTDGGTITFNGLYVEIIIPAGTVVINPDPNALNAPWSLSGPGGYLLAGNGDLTIPDLLLGDYTITWGDVPGWTTPTPETLALTDGATITFNGLYVEIPQVGTVVINPDPNALNAPWSLSGPGGILINGAGDASQGDAPVGDYTVTWGAVPGWTTPAPETLTLTDAGTITFNGLYVEIIPVGTVVLNPDPNGLNAPWSLSGPGGYLLPGNGDLTIPDLLLGDYTVTWGAVAGYTTPAPETLALTDGATITFNGIYVLIPVGNVVINPDPNEISAPWELSGPAGPQSGNGDLTLNGQLTGSYTITWLEVAGYETPAPETLTLNNGQTIIFAATYAPVGSGETIGFWFDQNATDSCAQGAFLAHVPAYIVYSDPSIGLTRGFECGISLSRLGGTTFNTSMSVTFPKPATNVGVNTPSTGQYNYIVGYSEPLVTTTNTVVATMDIFYLEFEALKFDMRAAVPASIPGTPVIMRDDFSLFGIDIGSPTATLQTVACPAKAAQADSFGEVRNLFR